MVDAIRSFVRLIVRSFVRPFIPFFLSFIHLRPSILFFFFFFRKNNNFYLKLFSSRIFRFLEGLYLYYIKRILFYLSNRYNRYTYTYHISQWYRHGMHNYPLIKYTILYSNLPIWIGGRTLYLYNKI